jgi:hypothetical protein
MSDTVEIIVDGRAILATVRPATHNVVRLIYDYEGRTRARIYDKDVVHEAQRTKTPIYI